MSDNLPSQPYTLSPVVFHSSEREPLSFHVMHADAVLDIQFMSLKYILSNYVEKTSNEQKLCKWKYLDDERD